MRRTVGTWGAARRFRAQWGIMSVSYTPLEIASIYNFPSRLNTFHGKTIYDGKGITIAIAIFDTYLASDVDYFWTYYYQINRTGTLTNICVNGCTSTLNYEPTLDVVDIDVDRKCFFNLGDCSGGLHQHSVI